MATDTEKVAMFKEFSGETYLPDLVVIQYLHNAPNQDIAAAIDNYFDNPSLYTVETYHQNQEQQRQQRNWDDHVFGQDRSGDDMGSGIPSFQIHAADESILHPTDHSNAPTRPPSRMSMRGGQESGVLGSSGSPFIGPVTKDFHYDPAQWALIPSTTAAEILLDPDPDQRRRDISRGEPVFMKPLPNKDPLASVVTILGHIPLARNTLADGPALKPTYGSNPEWWKGAKIELAVINDHSEPHHTPSYELLEESQRLMAFMYSSNRSYGSVQSLSELRALVNAKPGMAGLTELKTSADRYLAAWSNMVMELSLFPSSQSLFLTRALQISANGKQDDIPFHIIDIKLDPTDSTAPTRTLYDGADGLLWAEDPNGTSEDNYCLEVTPPVLFMRILNQDASKTGLDLDVLESWYLDRYLKENMIAAKQMRKERSKYTHTLQKLEERRKKFLRAKHPKSEKMLEAKDLIASTIKYLNPPKPVEKKERKDDEKYNKDQKHGEGAKKVIPAPEPTAPETLSPEQLRAVELANQLAGILEQVDKKLEELANEREKTQATMAELSKLFTDPNSTDDLPKHRYNLRGVSIGPDHVKHFVLVDPRPASQEDAPEHEDGAIEVAAPSQWWGIEYLYSGLRKQPVEIENVLTAASETRDVLLVYATDEACERTEFEPNEFLKAFVQKDNEYFSEEVAEHLQNSMHAEPDYQNKELPPAYDSLPPGDGRWVAPGADPTSSGWQPDPGPSVVSDAEYHLNTDPRYNQYVDFSASSSAMRPNEDVRMGGLAVERIEDVTEEETRVKGG